MASWASILWLALWFIGMAVFWLAVVGVAAWSLSQLFPRTGNGAQGHGLPEPAIEILKRRYARSEITRAEYQEMRRELEQ